MTGMMPVYIGILVAVIASIIILCVASKEYRVIFWNIGMKILFFLFYAAPSFVHGVVVSGVTLVFFQHGLPVIICYAAMLLSVGYFLKAVLLGWKAAANKE